MYSPLSVYSHYSLLHSCQKIESLIKRAKELGINSIGLADLGTISGLVEFASECKKSEIKPILGVTIKIDGTYLRLFAKNKNGWKKLISLVSKANDSIIDNEPSLNLDDIKPTQDLIAITGFRGSLLYTTIFSSDKFLSDDELSSYVDSN